MFKRIFVLFAALFLLSSFAYSAPQERFSGKIVILRSHSLDLYPESYTLIQLEGVSIEKDINNKECDIGNVGHGALTFFGFRDKDDSALMSIALAAYMSEKEVEVQIDRDQKIGPVCKVLGLTLK